MNIILVQRLLGSQGEVDLPVRCGGPLVFLRPQICGLLLKRILVRLAILSCAERQERELCSLHDLYASHVLLCSTFKYELRQLYRYP